MITVKLFAILRDKAGRSELLVSGSPATVSELLKQVSTEYPALSDALSRGRIMVSINQEFVKQDAKLKDGDEVALMPPFSGGGGVSENIRIQRELFSVDQEIARIKQSSTAIGAIVTFLGATRDVSQGKQVAKLEFEHYPGLAEKKLSDIRESGDQRIRRN